jgi:hypothetical protein
MELRCDVPYHTSNASRKTHPNYPFGSSSNFFVSCIVYYTESPSTCLALLRPRTNTAPLMHLARPMRFIPWLLLKFLHDLCNAFVSPLAYHICVNEHSDSILRTRFPTNCIILPVQVAFPFFFVWVSLLGDEYCRKFPLPLV